MIDMVRIEVIIQRKDCYAEAVYSTEEFIVKLGGNVRKHFASHIKSGKKARSLRDNREYVSDCGEIVQNCVFTSPSTASQFVLGTSSNGYETWKIKDDPKKSLGVYLQEKGYRK